MALLSDEVWAQLDPHEGRLSRRTTVRLWAAIAAVTLLVAAGLAVWRSGVVVPRLEQSDPGGFHYETGPNHFRYAVNVANEGMTSVTVTGVGQSGPGLRLISVDGPTVSTIDPSETVQFVLEYEVTDCSAVPSTSWPVPVRVSRPWGTQTAHVQPPTEESPDAPGSYSYSGRSPYAVEWQRALADRACALPPR